MAKNEAQMTPAEVYESRLANAEREAKRFLQRIAEFRAEAAKPEELRSGYPHKQRAAIRRASSDLTNDLAKLRRSHYVYP